MKHTYVRRIYYGETDKMGVSYYANYFVWYEEARTELFRDIGYPYTEIEAKNIYLPVINAQCRYFSPSTYDDLLTITTWVFLFEGVRLGFKYEVRKNDLDKLITTGETIHAFITEDKKKAILPQELKLCIENIIEKE
ncbi:acyl-CoA thioesterase [Chlamydiota bacterium]